MKTKVIPFPGRYFYVHRHPPLTSKMIVALLEAVEMQNQHIAFGPKDIKGSFTGLISRSLVVRKKIIMDNGLEDHWQVTDEAISLLNRLGFASKIPPSALVM